jgi:hypothetical protein
MSRNNVIMKPMRQESIGFFRNNKITAMVATIVKIIMPICLPLYSLSILVSLRALSKSGRALRT